MTGSIMRRPTPRKGDMDRAIKAAKDAGLKIAGLEVGVDGGFKVLTAGAHAAQPDELEAWRARRAERKAARA